jgi:hypothetical protein
MYLRDVALGRWGSRSLFHVHSTRNGIGLAGGDQVRAGRSLSRGPREADRVKHRVAVE